MLACVKCKSVNKNPRATQDFGEESGGSISTPTIAHVSAKAAVADSEILDTSAAAIPTGGPFPDAATATPSMLVPAAAASTLPTASLRVSGAAAMLMSDVQNCEYLSSSSSEDKGLENHGNLGGHTKTTGLTDDTSNSDSGGDDLDRDATLLGGNDVQDELDESYYDGGPTDAEASKFSFIERLAHYMEKEVIVHGNRKSVELAIMVEAGTLVREMDQMKKEAKMQAFLSEYLSIVQEIPDENFGDSTVRSAMLQSYKGAKKKEMDSARMWRKYEDELNELRKFAYKFPGVGSLSELPSGTNQVREMKHPLIMRMWKEKYPVRSIAL